MYFETAEFVYGNRKFSLVIRKFYGSFYHYFLSCARRIIIDTITDAVNNLSGMSITYSADELETIAGQMNSIGKMTHGMIPELVMGETFTWDSVANYLNTRIFVDE